MFNTKYNRMFFSPDPVGDGVGAPIPDVPLPSEEATPVTRHPQPRILKPDRSIVHAIKKAQQDPKVGATIATVLRENKKAQTVKEALSMAAGESDEDDLLVEEEQNTVNVP